LEQFFQKQVLEKAEEFFTYGEKLQGKNRGGPVCLNSHIQFYKWIEPSWVTLPWFVMGYAALVCGSELK